MIPDLNDIHAYRQWDREQVATWPRALADLPSMTFERVPVPAEAGVRELMLYRPDGVGGPLPVYVNLHGGGFVLGGWAVDDPYCRLLADTAGCAVVNLDYALAPEQPFPAAIEQTYALVAWLHEHGNELGLDGARIAVGGHSAGGNIAAAVSLLAADQGRPLLRGQIIDYAPLDLATDPAAKSNPDPAADPAMTMFAVRLARQYNAWYLADPAEARSPLASPLLAPSLVGLPPALVITAEYDTLRAEGDAYARRLCDAGVLTEHVTYPDCQHGFTHVGPAGAALDAWNRMARFLERVLT